MIQSLQQGCGRPSGYNTWGCKVTSSLAGHCETTLNQVSSRSLNSSTHKIKGSLWDVLAVLLLSLFWRPFLSSRITWLSFLQMKMSLSSTGVLLGLQDCWAAEAAAISLQRTAWGCLQEILVHSGLKIWRLFEDFGRWSTFWLQEKACYGWGKMEKSKCIQTWHLTTFYSL